MIRFHSLPEILEYNPGRLHVHRTNYNPEGSPILQSNVSNATLALLFPPGLLGGYRNQVLRFISFIVHAKKKGLNYLLRPSLLWSTQLGGIGLGSKWYPIPMEWVFDIGYWNSYSEHLPLIIDSIPQSDCWTTPPKSTDASVSDKLMLNSNVTLNPLQLASLQQGVLIPLLNTSLPFIAGILNLDTRKHDLLDQVQHCRNPFVYGGGTKAGRLWNDYLSFQKSVTKHAGNGVNSFVPYNIDQWIYRALQPAPQWQELGKTCVATHVPQGPYAVLHARVELEIMNHVCGREMERNLTRILHQVEGLLSEQSVNGLLIAVSRAGMETKSDLYRKYQNFADHNINELNTRVGNLTHPGTGIVIRNDHRKIPVFECGERLLSDFYQQHPHIPDHGSLLHSVINFHIAVHSDIFVGVKSSSYSTEVMTVRYYLGKGRSNYRYTKHGKIEPVENGGLPSPHRNCERRANVRKKQN